MILLSHTRVATLASQNYLFTHVVWDYFRLKFANSTCWNEIRSFTGISWRRCCNSPKYVCLCFPIFGSLYTREPFLHSDHLLADELIAYIFLVEDMVIHVSKVCAKVLSRLWSCSSQVSVSRIPIETRRTTKDDEEKKNEQKGFKGSSTGPPGEEIPRVPLRDLRGDFFFFN